MRSSYAIGIDLGGTKIEGVVVQKTTGGLLGEPIHTVRVPTEADKGFDHVVDSVVHLIDTLTEKSGDPGIQVGMGMPGSLTAEGTVRNSNAVCLNGTYFREEVVGRLGRPVRFANDADCFALAEAVMGAGRGYELVFGVIMGTGVGGGIVHNGVLREGPQRTSGEWGHMILVPGGNPCYCGRSGCVETYLAGPGLEKRYSERFGEDKSLKQICARPEPEFASEWMDLFGLAIGNVLNVLDPDVVVLGGGVSNAELLYTTGRAYVAEYVFSETVETPIVKHRLGDSAGVLGAALLV